MFRDLVTGNWNVTFSTNQNIEEALQTFSGKEMDVKLKQHREKRSLDANAYYWCLLTKLARIHGWSNAEAHNRMLRDYGQYERVEGQADRCSTSRYRSDRKRDSEQDGVSSGAIPEDHDHERTDKTDISPSARVEHLQHRRDGTADQRSDR